MSETIYSKSELRRLCVLSMVIGHFVFGMRKTEAVCLKCGADVAK